MSTNRNRHQRRKSITLTFSTILTSLVCLVIFADSAKSADRPNVLMIAVDDLNDWVGALGGHPQSKTPHIDRLAQQSMVFSNAHCAAPACNPSRTALLTGIRPWNSGVYLNPQPWRPVMPDVVTLPQHFMQHGYHARAGGKMYHGRYEDDQSWHKWFSSGNAPKLSERESKNPKSKSGGIVWGNLHDTSVEELPDYRLATWVSKYLSEEHDEPFFVGCGFKKPHMPWQVPGKYYDMFPIESIKLPVVPENDLNDIPSAGLRMAKPGGDHAKIQKSDNWAHAVQGYLATIAFLDDQVGRVLDALENGPHAENTIVIFWGDHGWHLGEKQHWRKFSLWEEATRAPLIISVPGLTKAGTRCDAPVDFMNIYPTLADLCDLPIGGQLDGFSMKPLLANPAAIWDHPAITSHGRNNNAVRTSRWRYIRYADGSEELYDHDADPNEWKNLADRSDLAAVKKRLAKSFVGNNKSAKDAPRDKTLN